MIDFRNNNEESEDSLFDIISMSDIGADRMIIKSCTPNVRDVNKE